MPCAHLKLQLAQFTVNDSLRISLAIIYQLGWCSAQSHTSTGAQWLCGSILVSALLDLFLSIRPEHRPARRLCTHYISHYIPPVRLDLDGNTVCYPHLRHSRVFGT